MNSMFGGKAAEPEVEVNAEVEKTCAFCRFAIPVAATTCGHCGKDQPQPGGIAGYIALGVVLTPLVLVGACFTFFAVAGSDSGREESSVLTTRGEVNLGTTWDDALPVLKMSSQTGSRLHQRQSADSFTETWIVQGTEYELTFERPAAPDFGPYVVTRILRNE